LKLDSKRNSVTAPPFRGAVRYACPGSVQKSPEDLLDILGIATAAEQLARDFQFLKNEVLIYCNTYVSRGYHAEGVALARLRKAAEGNWPAPSPGSPGSPERKAEQRIRNERAARMVDALARKTATER